MLELYFSQNFPFWNKLSPKEKNLLINNSEILKYKKNEIIHDSTECTGVLFVIKGQLRVYILSEEGKEITLYRLNENEVCILSASCILKNITFSIYVDAITDVEIIKISASAFKEIKNSNIAVEAFTTDIINKSFSETMWAMEQILFMSFDKRLARYLFEQDSDTINLTHEDIAKDVNSAREVVSRMLKYFQNEGIISLSRGSITILNRDKLKKIFS